MEDGVKEQSQPKVVQHLHERASRATHEKSQPGTGTVQGFVKPWLCVVRWLMSRCFGGG